VLLSLYDTIEDALKSAVDAGKDRSDAADTAFATAEEELDWYAAWHIPRQQWVPFHIYCSPVMPTYIREVLGDVQDIIEDAAQKDSYIAKTQRRLSTRLGINVRSECIISFLSNDTHLEIRFPSNELSGQGPLSNSPVAHRSSRGSSRDL